MHGGGDKQTRNSLKILDREQKKKKKPTNKKYVYIRAVGETEKNKNKRRGRETALAACIVVRNETNQSASDGQTMRGVHCVLAERDRCTRKNKVNGITRRRVI